MTGCLFRLLSHIYGFLDSSLHLGLFDRDSLVCPVRHPGNSIYNIKSQPRKDSKEQSQGHRCQRFLKIAASSTGFLFPGLLVFLMIHPRIIIGVRTAVLVTAPAGLVSAALLIGIARTLTGRILLCACLVLLVSIITALITILVVPVFYPGRLLFILILIGVLVWILIIVHDPLSFP